MICFHNDYRLLLRQWGLMKTLCAPFVYAFVSCFWEVVWKLYLLKPNLRCVRGGSLLSCQHASSEVLVGWLKSFGDSLPPHLPTSELGRYIR